MDLGLCVLSLFILKVLSSCVLSCFALSVFVLFLPVFDWLQLYLVTLSAVCIFSPVFCSVFATLSCYLMCPVTAFCFPQSISSWTFCMDFDFHLFPLHVFCLVGHRTWFWPLPASKPCKPCIFLCLINISAPNQHCASVCIWVLPFLLLV